jgi:hypothetical protein
MCQVTASIGVAVDKTGTVEADFDPEFLKEAEKHLKALPEVIEVRQVDAWRFELERCTNARRRYVLENDLRVIDTRYMRCKHHGVDSYVSGVIRQEKIHGALPKVDIRDLIPGESEVRHKGEIYIFIESQEGMALIVHADTGHAERVHPSLIDEAHRMSSPLNYGDWMKGYEHGWVQGRDFREIGTQKVGKVPSDYGRGFVRGHADGVENRWRATLNAPYNETVREGEAYVKERLNRIFETLRSALLRIGEEHREILPAGTCPIRKCEFTDTVVVRPGRIDIKTGGYDRIWMRRQLTQRMSALGNLTKHFTAPITLNGAHTEFDPGDFDSYTVDF